MTTDSQISRARVIASEIEFLPKVESASIDDWDSNGGFNLFVYLPHEVKSGFLSILVSLPGILARVKTIIAKNGGTFEWADGPKREYVNEDGRRYFNGYSRGSYKISFRIY